MVLDCKHVWNYISEYLEGTLLEETREDVQKHLPVVRSVQQFWTPLVTWSFWLRMIESLNYQLVSVSVCTLESILSCPQTQKTDVTDSTSCALEKGGNCYRTRIKLATSGQ